MAEEKKGWKPGDGVKAAWEACKDNPGHSVIGGLIGQIVIPIPGVGFGIGAVLGGWVGKKNGPQR